MTDRSARRWIWAALALQALGYGYDILWHAFLNPGVEPSTVAEMTRHLGTVHLPLYLGAACVLAATAVALEHRTRYAPAGRALPIALAGAGLSAFAEAWHATSHLGLDTHHAPVFGIMSAAGFLVVVGAMVLSRERVRRRTAGAGRTRRRAA